MAVYRTEISLLVRPFIPNGDFVLVEIFDVGGSGTKPSEFVTYRPEWKLLRGDHWKRLGQIKTHLVSKDAFRTGSCAVSLFRAFIQNASH